MVWWLGTYGKIGVNEVSFNRNYLGFISSVCFVLILSSCGNEYNENSAYAELQSLQKQQQEAHLTGNAALLVSVFAEDFMNIDSGMINTPTKKQASARFQSYFDRVEFITWDNIEEPVIKISKDGSMAYVIVQKFVHLKIPQSDGSEVESKTNFAWMEVWEKIEGTWKMKAISSTDKPSS